MENYLILLGDLHLLMVMIDQISKHTPTKESKELFNEQLNEFKKAVMKLEYLS